MANRTILLATLALVLAACGGDAKVQFVCDDGYRVEADGGVCVRLPDSCDADASTSIRTKCQTEHRSCVQTASQAACGACLPGFQDVDGTCTVLVTCASLDCEARHRSCTEADQVSQASCGNCDAGYVESGDACVKVQCAPLGDYPGLAAACADAQRLCVDGADGAECGACWDGYVMDQGGCRAAVECSLLGCVDAGKECIPAAGNDDARCGECLPGRDPGANCAPLDQTDCSLNGASSLAAVCAAAHRACAVVGDHAECGPCDDGYVSDPETGRCLKELSCDDLDCGSTHQACETSPTAHCAGCVDGYVTDQASATCRKVVECKDLECGSDVECAPASEVSDAFCRPKCDERSVWNGQRCQPCPACDGEGEDGVWAKPSTGGQCVCRTKPGYFASPGAEVGTYACDADGDGWVRESARNAENSVDPAIAANARCRVQTIDRVELVNEGAVGRVIELSQPVPLYEADRTDSDALWRATARARGLPEYGAGVMARDLHRMTKLCHTTSADYNDNGVPDVSEHAGLEPGPTLLDEQRVFNSFSYFMELHWGRYEPPESWRDHGRFVIREKTRLGAGEQQFAQLRVPMAYPSVDGSHWRTCRVARDNTYGGSPDVGFDFAQYESSSQWKGMNHHSQFKCLVVNDSATASDPGQIRTQQLLDGYRVNRCTASQRSTPGAVGGPVVRCELAADADVRGGDVVWGAARYVDHRRMGTPGEQIFPWNRGTAPYTRGCVNDCVDEIATCTGFDQFVDAIACIYDEQDFGRFLACYAEEICDGKDNDSDDDVDEGNPGGGAPCGTNLLGRCASGHLLCQGGEIICQPDRAPEAEQCNNLDDDCDGYADEEVGAGPNPTACVVKDARGAPRKGICGEGVLLCDDGSYSKCHPTAWDDGTYWDGTNPNEQPGQQLVEIGCNGIDDDCDGQVDECPVTSGQPGEHCAGYELGFGGNCDPGWNKYYQDLDGDKYPAKKLVGLITTCQCQAPTGYIPEGEARQGEDCCDSCSNGAPYSEAARVNPGEVTYRTGQTCCEDLAGGSFYDFNCNHRQETALNTYQPNPCYAEWQGGFRYACLSRGAAWYQSDAVACGKSGRWHNGVCVGNYFLGIFLLDCVPQESSRQQECR